MAFPDKSVYVWFCQITTCILWLGINFVFCANREPQKRPFDPPNVQEMLAMRQTMEQSVTTTPESGRWSCSVESKDSFGVSTFGRRVKATKSNLIVSAASNLFLSGRWQWNCESIPSSPIVINLAGLRLGSGSAATKTNTHVAKWAF